MADVYEIERESLLQRLLDSVKKCQATFGDKKNSLASENDSSVVCIIGHFEQVLLHGLKKNKVWEKITSIAEPLRQVTQKMLPEIDITYWSLLKEYLGSLDLQHFQTIEGITTDAGRARVWLRTALNENTLENHLISILGHATLRSQFYEPWALMMDEERSSTIPTMARGLGSILFAIDTKSVELNKPFISVFTTNQQESKTHRRIKSNPLPVMAERLDNEPTTSKSGNLKKKKKRKVVEATITDMKDDICDTTSLLSSSYSEGILNEAMLNTLNNTCTLPNNENENIYPVNYEQPVITSGDNRMDNEENKDKEHLISKYPGDKDEEQTILKYGDKDDRLLKLNNDTCSFPTQDMVAGVVDNMLIDSTDDGIKYMPDYSNECLSEQLKALNIIDQPSTPSYTPLFPDVDNVYDEETNLPSSEYDTTLPNVDTLFENMSPVIQDMPTVFFEAGTSKEIEDEHSLTEIDSCNETEELDKHYISKNDTSAILHEDVDSQHLEHTAVRDESTKTSSVLDMEEEDIYEVGSENSKYVQLLDFDQVSSQAVSDTLALVTQISKTDSMLQFNAEIEEPTSPGIEKYIPKIAPQPKENTSDDLSADDLKKVILANAKMKEEVEESKRLLHIAFNEQQEELCLLRMEHERMQKDFQEKELENERRIQELSDENTLLKKQLKYVITDDQSEEAIKESRDVDGPLLTSDDSSTSTSEVTVCHDVNEEENIFQGKLVQMAEMHGDVLELQENLQRQIIAKNNQIAIMKEQLVELRGPLPDNTTVEGSCESLESTYSCTQTTLVNIWIPSVFKKSKTPELHHIYQIYIRIGSEEWNIYRRYSQFNKLHTEVCKSHPVLENAVFPKKKLMKFDAKLVESRRLQLQDYLRTLINTLITNNSILASNTTRRQLVDLLPFFGEQFENDFSKSSKTNKVRNIDNIDSVYNGL